MVWRTRRWSGISIGPVTFSWQAAACGNSAAIRSSASMRWIGGGFLRPLRNRRMSRARLRFQRQRDEEHRRVEDRLAQRVLDRAARDVARHLVEREAVVRTERQHHRVVARRGLQLEVEGAAELLAQREPERPVDATTVGRVEHELHPAGVVEEALEHQVLLGRASRRAPRARPRGSRRSGRRPRRAARSHSTTYAAGAVGVAGGEELVDVAAQLGHLGRQLGGARRRLAHPERHRRVRRRRRRGPAPRPGSTRRICHEWVPSRKMSPAIDSTAQSSLTVPMNVSSGSATTR